MNRSGQSGSSESKENRGENSTGDQPLLDRAVAAVRA